MAKGTLLKKEDVLEIKKWLAKGFTTADIEEITKRSAKTIRKVRDGGFDYMLQEAKPEVEIAVASVPTVSESDSTAVVAMLQRIIEKLDVIIERMDTCDFLK